MAVPDISRPRTTSADCVHDYRTTFEDLLTSPHDQLLFPNTPDCFEQFQIVGNTSTEFTDLSGPYQTNHRPFPTSYRLYTTFPDHLGRDRSPVAGRPPSLLSVTVA